MTEAHGTDINETISLRELNFSAQLTIGAAKWLERKTGKSILEAAQSLTPTSEKDLDVGKISMLLTALYIAAHPRIDPAEAEAAVDTLKFAEMLDVFSRAHPFEFEAKNPPEATPTEPPPSTGQPSSTT